MVNLKKIFCLPQNPPFFITIVRSSIYSRFSRDHFQKKNFCWIFWKVSKLVDKFIICWGHEKFRWPRVFCRKIDAIYPKKCVIHSYLCQTTFLLLFSLIVLFGSYSKILHGIKWSEQRVEKRPEGDNLKPFVISQPRRRRT